MGSRSSPAGAEPCINGMTVTLGVYFGQPVDGIITRLIGEQLDNGGWNCWAEYGAVVSKQQPDGTWLLENTHPGAVHFALDDGDARTRRWNTLRALRIRTALRR